MQKKDFFHVPVFTIVSITLQNLSTHRVASYTSTCLLLPNAIFQRLEAQPQTQGDKGRLGQRGWQGMRVRK